MGTLLKVLGIILYLIPNVYSDLLWFLCTVQHNITRFSVIFNNSFFQTSSISSAALRGVLWVLQHPGPQFLGARNWWEWLAGYRSVKGPAFRIAPGQALAFMRPCLSQCLLLLVNFAFYFWRICLLCYRFCILCASMSSLLILLSMLFLMFSISFRFHTALIKPAHPYQPSTVFIPSFIFWLKLLKIIFFIVSYSDSIFEILASVSFLATAHSRQHEITVAAAVQRQYDNIIHGLYIGHACKSTKIVYPHSNLTQ